MVSGFQVIVERAERVLDCVIPTIYLIHGHKYGKVAASEAKTHKSEAKKNPDHRDGNLYWVSNRTWTE